jgi:hypothetical protein
LERASVFVARQRLFLAFVLLIWPWTLEHWTLNRREALNEAQRFERLEPTHPLTQASRLKPHAYNVESRRCFGPTETPLRSFWLKTGARQSGITHSARIEKGNKKKFSQERLCLLTCLLMGDPGAVSSFRQLNQLFQEGILLFRKFSKLTTSDDRMRHGVLPRSAVHVFGVLRSNPSYGSTGKGSCWLVGQRSC